MYEYRAHCIIKVESSQKIQTSAEADHIKHLYASHNALLYLFTLAKPGLTKLGKKHDQFDHKHKHDPNAYLNCKSNLNANPTLVIPRRWN